MKMRKKAIRALSSGFMNKQIVNSKRSQFKIQQQAFMLLAVVLFFILVGLFWLSIQYRGIYKQASQLEENKVILISEFLSDSAEFSCKGETYCIDTDKIMVLKESVYKEFWPSDISYIKIRKLDGQEDKVCNNVNYPDCNIYKVLNNEDGKGKGSFVALCRYDKIEGYSTRICELGKLIIGYKI